MACDVQELIDEGKCFECVTPGFWPLLELQLLCQIAESGGGGGGALTPYTKTEFVAPVGTTMPFNFTATRRTHINFSYFLSVVSGADLARINFARTGFSGVYSVSLLNNVAGETFGCVSFDLSPGDTITTTEASIGAGLGTLSAISILEE